MPIPQEFLSDFKKVQSGELAYIVYSYDKNLYLNLADKSENFDEDEFIECFNTSKGSHAVLGVQLNDLRKTILVNWLGDSAPPQLKGRYAGLVSEMDALITTHVVHNARSESDISYKMLESLVMKASGAKYNLANTSTVSMSSKLPTAKKEEHASAQITSLKSNHPPTIPSKAMNSPKVPVRSDTLPSPTQSIKSPVIPSKSHTGLTNKLASSNPPFIPAKNQFQTTRSTTAQMIADQNNDINKRERSPSPPKRTVPDHRKEIQELRNISLQAAATYNPEPEPARLSSSDLRKLELEEMRLNPPTTAADFETENVKKLSEPELRKQEYSNIKSTAAIKTKFQQLENENIDLNIKRSPGSSLNDLRSKFEQPRRSSFEHQKEPQPLLPKREQEQVQQPLLPKREQEQVQQPLLPKREQEQVQQPLLPKRELLSPSRKEDQADAVALYDYTATESNEISFKQGDLIFNIVKIDKDWWQGVVGSSTGLFPFNFVKETRPDGEPQSQSAQLKPIKAIALYDYVAQEGNEISFKEGDAIYITDKVDDGWWQGTFESNTGLFPSAYGIK
eukprot:NODE_711_length_4934_cov_0.531954.p1 type:complete len:563 gc:universal NODE_711_length_4934_cov_0.531954:3963-2275(-)